MAIIDLIINYLVPVVGGVFILFFISLFLYILHRAVLKPIGFYTMIKNLGLKKKRNKLLADDKVVEYCVARVENNWTEAKVREELLLANKYSKQRIDEMIYAFNIIKKEMGSEDTKKQAPDLP